MLNFLSVRVMWSPAAVHMHAHACAHFSHHPSCSSPLQKYEETPAVFAANWKPVRSRTEIANILRAYFKYHCLHRASIFLPLEAVLSKAISFSIQRETIFFFLNFRGLLPNTIVSHFFHTSNNMCTEMWWSWQIKTSLTILKLAWKCVNVSSTILTWLQWSLHATYSSFLCLI